VRKYKISKREIKLNPVRRENTAPHLYTNIKIKIIPPPPPLPYLNLNILTKNLVKDKYLIKTPSFLSYR